MPGRFVSQTLDMGTRAVRGKERNCSPEACDRRIFDAWLVFGPGIGGNSPLPLKSGSLAPAALAR